MHYEETSEGVNVVTDLRAAWEAEQEFEANLLSLMTELKPTGLGQVCYCDIRGCDHMLVPHIDPEDGESLTDVCERTPVLWASTYLFGSEPLCQQCLNFRIEAGYPPVIAVKW